MKKLLNILLILTSITSSTVSVVACSSQSQSTKDYDYDIAVAINKITYSLNVGLNDQQDFIKKQITGQFIKLSLDKILQDKFNDNKLKINDITYNGHSLKPQDLNQLGQIKTLLTLTYGLVKVETKLNLIINDQYQNQVATAISNGNYEYTNDTNSSFKDLQAVITTNFVNSKLDSTIKKELHIDELIIKDFLKDNKPLVPSDFKVTGTFFITVNFQYYDIKSNFMLKMFLNPTVTNEIFNAISNSVYSKSVIAGSSVNDLTNIITVDFIKNKLSEQNQKNFINQKWKFINLLKSDKSQLTNNDLMKPSNLDLILQFSYDSIQGQSTLELNINQNADSKMIEKIENLNIKYFWLTIPYRDAEQYFTADFIKQNLSLNNQKDFQASKYKFIKLDWTGMDDGRLFYIYKLHFSYNNQEGTLPFIQASDVFSRFSDIAKLEINSGTTIDDLTKLFWNNYQKFIFKNTVAKYKGDYQFVIDTFKLQLLGFMNEKQQPLTNDDLVNKGNYSIFIGLNIDNEPSILPFQLIIN